MAQKIKWLDKPRESNYPNAVSYLSLIFDTTTATNYVDRLKEGIGAQITTFKAKDIFRASGLSLLGVSNERVKKDLKKIAEGEELSPILLVRDTIRGRVIIADGYHRMCAVYEVDEDADIPCIIVG